MESTGWNTPERAMIVRQFLRKRARIAKGAWNTYIARRGIVGDNRGRWDRLLYAQGVSDRLTIAPEKSDLAALYHYRSVELQILRYLLASSMRTEGCAVLDLGAGACHWIDFYRALGSSRTVAVDVARSCVEHLRARYTDRADVTILQGSVAETLAALDERFDIINAIGVMFHVVDDREWTRTIEQAGRLLERGGVLITGGHFGQLDGINLQVDRDGLVNKRLRSKRRWERVLRAAGFTEVTVYRNPAYLWVAELLPENHLLVATK
ncbi:hypothetical protein BH24PSE2_BH24PSE2_03100 [soil metagenome]